MKSIQWLSAAMPWDVIRISRRFCEGALPGERVMALVTLVKDHYATAETVSVLRSSLDRVTPPCPIFEECGGCQWQHFDYPRQLLTKTQFVKDAIERIGKLKNITVHPCLASPSPYAYRNKALPVLSMRDGHFISGIYEPRSHQLVPYETCPIQGDAINDLIRRVLEKIDQAGLTPYQEKSHTGFLRHLGVRQGFKPVNCSGLRDPYGSAGRKSPKIRAARRRNERGFAPYRQRING